jgi:glycine/D-amino acid oxidase-like deaminating enzyme
METEKINSTSNEIPTNCEVVIVGAGVAGAGAAYHLAMAGVKDIVVLECGNVGHGRTDPLSLQKVLKNLADTHIDAKETDFPHSYRSGSSVMPNATTVKMIIQLYECTSEEFLSHHGKDGGRRYLRITKLGIQYQKEIAAKVLPSPDTQIRTVGSLYLAYEKDEEELKQEYDTLRELGCDNIEWWYQDKISKVAGCSDKFHCAIYFPDDAIVDSSSYSKALLDAAIKTGCVRLYEGCSPVHSTTTEKSDNENVAVTVLENGTKIVSKHVVLATGGLFTKDLTLSGILRPCYSYLSSLPHPEVQKNEKLLEDSSVNVLSDGTPKFSLNFFTWRFTHDWCWTNYTVRVSGEDHFSALKPPRAKERCGNMITWVEKQYPEIFKTTDTETYNTQYGVYSETPDHVPIIGHTNDESKVCYLLGCNAWGQAVLSYLSSLVPSLLGYKEMTEEQKDLYSLVAIQRFTLLPSVLNGSD